MLLACSSTSEQVIGHAMRTLSDTTMLHVQEVPSLPSVALRRFLEINLEENEEAVTAYETHADVWPYLRGQNVSTDFSAEQEKYLGGLLNCISHCIGRDEVCLTVLPGRRGQDETLHNLIFIFYALGIKVVNATMLCERQDQGETVIESSPVPCGYFSRVRLADPDVLVLLIIHSLLSEGRTIKGLSNVGQIRDMLMKQKLTRYLPAKKGARNADGYYKALQRTSKEMTNCSLLSHSSVKRKDEYAITTLGLCCLKIAKLLPSSLGKDGKRIMDDYDKIAMEVTTYERKP